MIPVSSKLYTIGYSINNNVYEALKPNGIYLMLECTKSGLIKI